MRHKTPLANALEAILEVAGFPSPQLDFQFGGDENPAWRFDFAFPDFKLGILIPGGLWAGARGNGPGSMFPFDAYAFQNAAQIDGWIVLIFSAPQVQDGRALLTLEKAFARIKGGKL